MSYKTELRTESYLDCISAPRFRIALSKLRFSSHNLEIERGPKKDVDERVCLLCNVVDDEIHFVTNCCINETGAIPKTGYHQPGVNPPQ